MPRRIVQTGSSLAVTLPKDIVDRLSAEIMKDVGLPDMKEKLQAQGMDPFILNAEQFAALIKSDMARFASIVKAANIKVD